MQCLCGPDTSLCTNVVSVHPSCLSPHFLFPFVPIFSSSPSIPFCPLFLVYPQFLLFPSFSPLSHIPLLPFLFQVLPLFPFTSPHPPSFPVTLFFAVFPSLPIYLFFSPFCFPLSSFTPPSLTFCLLPPQCCAGLKEKRIRFSKVKIIFIVWHWK